MTTDRETFKAIRRRLGYTQAALGRVLSVQPHTIRRYEMDASNRSSREIRPHIMRFMRLLDSLGRAETDRITAEIDPPG